MRALVVSTLAAAALVNAAAGEPFTQAQLDAAHDALAERLAGCPSPSTCAAIYARIALEERPGGALEKLARDGLMGSIGQARKGLTQVFAAGDAEARRRTLELYRERWDVLGRGFDPNLSEKCVLGLEDEDPAVRRAAARLIAGYPVPGTAHAAIDAATLDPSLTQAAIMAIGVSRSGYVARWVVSQLTNEDEAVRGSARHALYALGRSAAHPLKEAIGGDDPARRDAALEALLPMASAEDVPLLYEWLTTHGDASPELGDRVVRAIAEIESGLYKGEPPPAVPLDESFTSPPSGR